MGGDSYETAVPQRGYPCVTFSRRVVALKCIEDNLV